MVARDKILGVLLLSAARHQGMFAEVMSSHPNLRLVAVADEPDVASWIREANLQVAAKHDLPYIDDVDAALARSDVDMVSICPEYYRHALLGIKALAAGKHILLDKQPFGMTVEESRSLLTVAREAAQRGVKLTYMHHSLDGTIQRAKQIITEGQIGEPRAVHARLTATYGPGDDPDISPTGRYGRGYHPTWWTKGELIHFGGYPIAVARYMMGSEVTSVYTMLGSYFNRLHQETGIDDWATLSLHFANGGVGTVVIGRAPNRAALNWGDNVVYVVGTHGTVAATDPPSFLVCDSRDGTSRHEGYSPDTTRLVIDDLLRAILQDKTPVHDHEDGFAEMQVLLAGYLSADEGRAVNIPLE